MIQFLHSLRSRLSQLRRAHQSLHILARPTTSVMPPALPGVAAHWVAGPSDPFFPQMLAMQNEQGLDEAWCIEQLKSGCSCVVATLQENQNEPNLPAGVGMYTRGEFWVGEIDHLYHPGPRACYLFATYVSPRFRGRRIQRLLDLSRVQRGAQEAASHAIAIVVSSNTASLRGHAAGGFRPVARIDHLRLGRCSIMLVRKKTSRAPVGNFPGGGFLGSNCLHFSRSDK